MKRVVSSSIITLLIIVAGAATYIYLKNFRSGGGDPVKAIPADASFYFIYNNPKEGIHQLTKPSFWNTIKQAPVFSKLYSQLQFLDSASRKNSILESFISEGSVYVSGHVTGAREFDFIILKSLPGTISEESIKELVVELAGQGEQVMASRNYDGTQIYECGVSGNRTFSFAISKGVFISSFTPFLVEDALRQLKLGKSIAKDFKTLEAGTNAAGITLFANVRALPAFLSVFTKQSVSAKIVQVSRISGWMQSAIGVSSNKLTFAGNFDQPDSTAFIYCFEGQTAIEKHMLKIIPRKAAFISYYGLSDFNKYYSKLHRNYFTDAESVNRDRVLQFLAEEYKLKAEEKMLEWMGGEYALVITEPSGENYDNNSFAIFKAKKPQEAIAQLKTISRIIDKKDNSITKEEGYNDHTIGLIKINNLLPAMFGNQFKMMTRMYYTSIGNYIVFANQASSLRSFIDDYENGAVLTKDSDFSNATEGISGKGSCFVHVNPAASLYLLRALVDPAGIKLENYKDLISGMQNFTLQVNAGATVSIEGSVGFASGGKEEGVNRLFSFETDSAVSKKVFVINDPETGSGKLLFYDDAHTIYMTDNAGNEIWKKDIQGEIKSEIFQIDLFRNNTKQLLFNTADYLYLLDMEGKPVGNYPIRLPSPATNGIAVFDFDGNRDPRIYVACSNQRVYAFQSSGKPMSGWNFNITTGAVNSPVRAAKLNGKDYLLITDEEGGVSMVNRYGEGGVLVSKGFTIGKNSKVFQDSSGTIITTDKKGSIVSMSSDGHVTLSEIGQLEEDYGFYFADVNDDNSNDYIFTDGNELIAYSRNLAVIFRKEFDDELKGPITSAVLTDGRKVFLVSSKKSNKTWMVYQDGSIAEGFPVKGDGAATIGQLNADGKQNLIVGSSDSHIYVYSLE